MMFLNGILAAFAVLGAVPIIIHLLNKSRFKVIDWGAMEFILKTLQKNSRRLQLRDLILMILRTLAIILLALALARPTITTDGGFSALGMGGGVNAVVVLDNGMSMQTRDVNDSRFELARKAAKDVLDGLPQGSAATLVLSSDVAVAEVAEPTQDLAFLDQALAKVQVTEGGSDVAAALRLGWQILEPLSGGAREIYLVGDLQAKGWPDAQNRAWRDLIETLDKVAGLRIYVVDTGSDDSTNVAVERIAFVDDLVGTDGVSTVVATLRNYGDAPVSGVPVDLFIDDGTGMRSAATTVIDTLDRTAQVRLDARFEHGGRHKVEVRSGPDRLAADNVRRTVVDVIDRLRVLVVDGSAEGGEKEGATFLRAALAPASLMDPVPGADGPGNADRIELTVVAPAQLVGLHLDDYQTVILSDVPAPSAGLAAGLRAYVASGRGLITLIGAAAQAEAYNTHFVEAGLLPGPIGPEPKRYAKVDDPTDGGASFSTDNLVHPIVALFASKETQPFLAQPRIRRLWPIEVPPEEAGKTNAHSVIARLADGQPVLITSTVGRGQVVTMAMGADKQWSDLPLRPVFLMLLRRTIQHVALGDRPRLAVEVNEPIVQAVSARDANGRFVVRHPVDQESPAVPIAREDGRVQVEFNDTNRAGYIDLVKDSTVWSFAVNPHADESDLTRLSREAIDERLAPLKVVWMDSEDDVASRVELGRSGREIWHILFILALLCLIAESVLALRWAPRST